MDRTRLGIVIAAVVIRALLLPGKGFPDDLHAFATWMHAMVDIGPRAIYEDVSNTRFPAVDYPPAYLYVLFATGKLEQLFFGAHPSILIDRVFEKLPAVVADFIAAFAVAGLVERFRDRRAGTVALAALLLAPMLWFVSAYWGQVDVIAALGLIFTIRAALARRFLLMWVVAAITITIKPQPVVVFPLLFAYQAVVATKRRALLLLGPAAALVTAYLVALPAAPNARFDRAIVWLFERYTVGVAKYPNNSSGAFNVFTVLQNAYQPDSAPLFGVSLRAWGTIATLLALALIACVFFLRLIKLAAARRAAQGTALAAGARAQTDFLLIHASALALLTLFTLMTRMHERYVMAAIALMPLVALIGRVERAAAILICADFCANALFIILGFYGGKHHPEILYVVHAISIANVGAYFLLLQRFVSRPAEIAVDRLADESVES